MAKHPFPHDEGTLANSGHAALQLLLSGLGNVKKVWMPYYTCDIVAVALQEMGVAHGFYHVDRNLEMAGCPDLGDNEYIIYTNYFGIKDSYLPWLAQRYGGSLIIDNAQAFFAAPHRECHQIYSPRKFVGVPDGGILVTRAAVAAGQLPQSHRWNSSAHLLKRAEGLVREGYPDFKESDRSLRGVPPLAMSKLTRDILHSLDWLAIKERRRANFRHLHSRLARSNGLGRMIDASGPDTVACPMVYPYWSEGPGLRQELIDSGVFVARYWPNVEQWCATGDVETALLNHVIPLPIDQRYDTQDMERIINIIEKQEGNGK